MGNSYRKAALKGTLELRNFRASEITLIARSAFSGELTSAEAEPAKSLLSTGVGHVNARRELTWTLKMPPGEARKVHYEYTVLVRN